MNQEKRNPPAGNQGDNKISSGDKPIIPQTTGNTDWPTPEETADLIMSHPRARAVNWEGYQRGYLDGVEYAKENLLDVEQAQLAVRLFQAAQEDEESIRRDMKLTREWFGVERARAEQRAEVHHG